MDTSETFPLLDTFKRYKIDTATLVSWLGEAATKCGFTAHITSTSSEKAKWKSSKKAGRKNTKPPPKSVISLRQFLVLAQAIADSEAKIPLSILLVLKHIIQARGECADWYSSQDGDEKHIQANEGHRFALDIFKKVLDILLPRASEGENSAKKVPEIVDNQGNTIELSNSFDALDVEDLPSDIEEAMAQNPSVKRKPKSYERVYEFEDPLADFYMETFFFFRDLHKLRLYIKRLWKDYHDGKVDLASASVTTEMAYDLLQRSEIDLYESLAAFDSANTFDDYEKTGARVWMRVCADRGLDATEFHPELYDIKDSLCFHTFCVLKKYLSNQEAYQLTVTPWRGIRDIVPQNDREALSPHERDAEDNDVLWALLPDIQVLPAIALPKDVEGKGKNKTPAADTPPPLGTTGPLGKGVATNDRLSNGLKRAQCTGKIPIWLVFAVQSLIDIFHIMRHQPGRSLAEVRLTAARYEKSLNEYFEFSRGKVTLSWSASETIASHHKTAMDFIKEWVHEDKIGNLRALVSPDVRRTHRFWLLTYHPMLCGAFIFSMNLTMQVSGRALAHIWGCTIGVIHLYNATKTRFSKASWPDLDCLIDIHGENFLFYGGAPRYYKDYLKKFWLSMGNSISNLAHDRRPNQRSVHAEQRKLTSVVSISKLFEPRYCDTVLSETTDYKKGQKLSCDSMKLLQSKAQMQKEASPPQEVMDPSKEFRLPYKGLMKKDKRVQDPEKLTPIQLLDALCIALNSEYTALNIDYLSIHVRCMKLLREIHGEIGELCKDMYGNDSLGLPDNFDLDQALGGLPFFIFWSNAECEGLARGNNLLVKAAKILERVAEEEGSIELDSIMTLKEECERVRAEPEELVALDEEVIKEMLTRLVEEPGSRIYT